MSLKKIKKNPIHPTDTMPSVSRRAVFLFCAVLLTACSKIPSGDSAPALMAAPTPPRASAPLPAPEPDRAETGAPDPAPVPAQSPGVNVSALEQRFLAAPSNPAERIAAVQELADVPPAAALAMLNRVYPLERREDVKMEMLAALGDLDHGQNRDNQLALCLKALAPGQPPRVRYVAIQVLSDLRDPRARALLIPLTSDSDREVRAAAVGALRDLAQD